MIGRADFIGLVKCDGLRSRTIVQAEPETLRMNLTPAVLAADRPGTAAGENAADRSARFLQF